MKGSACGSGGDAGEFSSHPAIDPAFKIDANPVPSNVPQDTENNALRLHTDDPLLRAPPHTNCMKDVKITLRHKDATVHVDELPSGRNSIRVELSKGNDSFCPIKSCETSYPVSLIENILNLKGPSYLCDEILRDESPSYVQDALKYDLLAYQDIQEFNNKRLLDFGCGGGASTMVLARMFPHTEIVGIELEERLLSIAQLRRAHYGYKNITLMLSPEPDSLPQSIGRFDYVVLSAVYEHLLPNERGPVLSQVWNTLAPGGILFLNQTPYRYSPVEMHTTCGLPFINYLPATLAFVYASRFSKTRRKYDTWEQLLRAGIRGGSCKGILGILRRSPQKPILLSPSKFGLKDRIDLWRIQSSKARLPLVKRLMSAVLKLIQVVTGVTIVPSLSLAIKKEG